MLQTPEGSILHRVSVIDDEAEVRASYAEYLEDLGLEPVDVPGPIVDSLDRFVEASRLRSQAAICDHRMKPSSYAGFDGAQLVSEFNQKRFPALLCTRFEADIDEIRPYRKHIPILLNWEDLMDPDTILLSFERLVAELRGEPPPSRRPWRTLVHVYDVDCERGFVHIFLPGWDPHKGLRLRIKDLPLAVRPLLRPDYRLLAHVNIGAENPEDLFFDNWEIG
jgi:CheY-like chemotaxis protein